MKYEYKVVHQAEIHVRTDGAEYLIELGREGWELVCYNSDIYYYMFKRPLGK